LWNRDVGALPVDFSAHQYPVVVVATFYSGMPPQQVKPAYQPFPAFFTLASGVDHIESRSLPGVSLVKIYFNREPAQIPT
jgi:multidrug efflux pump subunit AcrB